MPRTIATVIALGGLMGGMLAACGGVAIRATTGPGKAQPIPPTLGLPAEWTATPGASSPTATHPLATTPAPAPSQPRPASFPGADLWLLRVNGMSATDLAATDDGGVLLLARPNPALSGSGVLFRLDGRGTIGWQQGFQVSNPSGAAQVGDGGVAVFDDLGLTKFDADGRFAWEEILHGQENAPIVPAFDGFDAAELNQDGQTIVESYALDVLDPDGSFLSRTSPGRVPVPDDFRVKHMSQTARWDAGLVDFSGYWVQQSSADASWVLRFDFSYTGSDVHSAGEAIVPTADGGVLFVGLVPYLRSLAYNVSIWAVRLDSLGGIVWQTALDGGDERQPALSRTADGGFLIATGSGYMADEVRPLRLQRLKADGSVVWDRFVRPGSDRLLPQAVVEASDGSIVVAAQVVGWDDESGGDLILMKVDADGRLPGCTWMEDSPFKPPVDTTPETSLEGLSATPFQPVDLTVERLTEPLTPLSTTTYSAEAICVDSSP